MNHGVPVPFSHHVRVRYGECDRRGNAHHEAYLAYVDDTADLWFKATLSDHWLDLFDFMVKRVTLDLPSPVRYDDEFEMVPAVTRWGTTSFDVTTRAVTDERVLWGVEAVYVCVEPDTGTPMPVPDRLRAALSSP